MSKLSIDVTYPLDVVTDDDCSRYPVFSCVRAVPHPDGGALLMATNSFVAAFAKSDAKIDKPANIPARFWRRKDGESVCIEKDNKWRRVSRRAKSPPSTLVEPLDNATDNATFPKVQNMLPEISEHVQVTINVKNLTALAKAIGKGHNTNSDGSLITLLVPTKEKVCESPIVCMAEHQPTLGLIMPVPTSHKPGDFIAASAAKEMIKFIRKATN